MVYIAAKEDLFVYKVAGECHCRNAESRERALEAVPSCERASISPCLTVDVLDTAMRSAVAHDAYARAHGSFFGCPAAAANFCGSKPVTFGLGAILMSVRYIVREFVVRRDVIRRAMAVARRKLC